MGRSHQRLFGRILPIIAATFLTACGCDRGEPVASEANSNAKKTDKASATVMPRDQSTSIASNPTPTPQTSAKHAPLKTSATPKPAIQAAKSWSYGESKDEMRGEVRKYATKESVNTVNFDFPYRGVQHGTIMVCGDDSVLFYVEKGQITCHGGGEHGTCLVLVKFDDEQERYVKAEKLGDDSTTLSFIEPEFLDDLKQSKKLMIQVEVYHNGLPVFTFDVSGLKAI